MKAFPRFLLRLLNRISARPVPAALPAPDSLVNPLKDLKGLMGDRSLTVVANREPYIHQRSGDKVRVVRPASGLVTALEPILKESGGLWIAHGSGDADREMADENSEVSVPPGLNRYRLRRVFLSEEEEAGYYYGFSNEGLWPLCHLAHTRPTFRLSDWQHYLNVNQKFAEAVVSSSSVGGNRPLLMVQDYHFAILPRIVRESLREATPEIGLFWHIPWPNPETFGICPWAVDVLKGMLGSDVIGFHTQYHCNNFLETCERYLEARVDWAKFSVTMDRHETLVRPFPIGIDTSPVVRLNEEEKVLLKRKYGIKARHIAVGVDRIDYTKGILERVEAVERFLEKYPEYVGEFSLVQIGAPSRTRIPAYQQLFDRLNEAVDRVNQRFRRSDDDAPAIMFISSHYEWDEIQYFYQLGDICMVTSLHDGMNLVAKEYVWCQQPENGSLILSKFTGACRELSEAFIVNPYSMEEVADAIGAALALSPDERAKRMGAMRQKVASYNAFHWASDLIRTLLSVVPGSGAFSQGSSRYVDVSKGARRALQWERTFLKGRATTRTNVSSLPR